MTLAALAAVVLAIVLSTAGGLVAVEWRHRHEYSRDYCLPPGAIEGACIVLAGAGALAGVLALALASWAL